MDDYKVKYEQAMAEVDKLKAELRNRDRAAVLVKAGYDEAKAKDQAEKLAGLNDAAFSAHATKLMEYRQASYEGQKLADYKKAGNTPAKPTPSTPPPQPAKAVPQATDLPAPMAGEPQKVAELRLGTLQREMSEYLSSVFGTDEQEAEPAAVVGKANGKKDVNDEIREYVGDIFGSNDAEPVE